MRRSTRLNSWKIIADAPAGGAQLAPRAATMISVAQAHGAAVGLDQPVDAAEQRGLAGAGGADDEDRLGALDGEAHPASACSLRG